jgi:hypothetical protein
LACWDFPRDGSGLATFAAAQPIKGAAPGTAFLPPKEFGWFSRALLLMDGLVLA